MRNLASIAGGASPEPPAELPDGRAEDAALVSKASGGDQAAFRGLFDKYAPLVHRLAWRLVGEADAGDLTQETFIRAHRGLGSLQDGRAFQAWITRLAINLCHDHLRRRGPGLFSLNAPPPGADEGAEWQISDGAPGNVDLMLSREATRQVRAALDAVPEDYRRVLILHHLEELPVEEIALTLGVPEGTVKSRLSRGRVLLRRRLQRFVEG